MTTADHHQQDDLRIDMGKGRNYVLPSTLTEAEMHALACGILTRLGVSYDLRVPGHTDGWGGREHVLRKVHEDSENYAARRSDDPHERETLAEAYRAGFWKSPKPISYPVKR